MSVLSFRYLFNKHFNSYTFSDNGGVLPIMAYTDYGSITESN